MAIILLLRTNDSGLDSTRCTVIESSLLLCGILSLSATSGFAVLLPFALALVLAATAHFQKPWSATVAPLGTLHNCQQLTALHIDILYTLPFSSSHRYPGHTSPLSRSCVRPCDSQTSRPHPRAGGPIAAHPPWRLIAHPRIL